MGQSDAAFGLAGAWEIFNALGKNGPTAAPIPPRSGAAASESWREEAVAPVSGGGSGSMSGPGQELSGSAASAGAGRSRAASVFGRRKGDHPLPATGHLVEDDLSRLALLRVRHDPERVWTDLAPLTLDPGVARAHHLLVSHQEDPVGLLYDHLRTRLLQALSARDWHRVAITAPTRGCGASLLAANLALSLARRPSGRSVLMDMDFRKPALADLFGIAAEAPGGSAPLRDLLTEQQPMEAVLRRFGRTLALGLNGRAEGDAAELLQEPSTQAVLRQMIEDLSPDVVLYDLPPLLESDDVLAFLPQVDGVLLVVDGTRNTAAQVRECERLLKAQTEFLGVVMNRAEDSPAVRRKRR